MSNVRDFGAIGDGRADDTEAIQHAIDEGVGLVEFPVSNDTSAGLVIDGALLSVVVMV